MPQASTVIQQEQSAPLDFASAKLCCAERQSPVEGTELSDARGLLLRRLRYVAHFVFYLAVHRSISSARWAIANEGLEWN